MAPQPLRVSGQVYVFQCFGCLLAKAILPQWITGVVRACLQKVHLTHLVYQQSQDNRASGQDDPYQSGTRILWSSKAVGASPCIASFEYYIFNRDPCSHGCTGFVVYYLLCIAARCLTETYVGMEDATGWRESFCN